MIEPRALSHYVGGQWVAAAPSFDSLNPSDTRDIVARVPADDGEIMGAAVRAARGAFPEWADTTPEVRSDLLDRIGSTILARKEELGRLLSREEGKTLPEGIGEVARAGRIYKFFAEKRCVGAARPSIRRVRASKWRPIASQSACSG